MMSQSLEPQMHTDEHRLETNQITEKIIGCFYQIGNSLGSGFLEKVYENALAHELRKNGLEVRQQFSIQVKYDEIVVGDYVADLLVENEVLIELKAVKELDKIHKAQCINYLKATGFRVCLLVNFGNPKIDFERIMV